MPIECARNARQRSPANPVHRRSRDVFRQMGRCGGPAAVCRTIRNRADRSRHLVPHSVYPRSRPRPSTTARPHVRGLRRTGRLDSHESPVASRGWPGRPDDAYQVSGFLARLRRTRMSSPCGLQAWAHWQSGSDRGLPWRPHGKSAADQLATTCQGAWRTLPERVHHTPMAESFSASWQTVER